MCYEQSIANLKPKNVHTTENVFGKLFQCDFEWRFSVITDFDRIKTHFYGNPNVETLKPKRPYWKYHIRFAHKCSFPHLHPTISFTFFEI